MKHATSHVFRSALIIVRDPAVGALLVLGGLMGALFAFTQVDIPHRAELRYAEASSHAAGSVIPASCSSLPPAEHVPGELAGCAPTVTLQFVP